MSRHNAERTWRLLELGFEQVLFWHHRITWPTSTSETQISSLAYGYRFATLRFSSLYIPFLRQE